VQAPKERERQLKLKFTFKFKAFKPAQERERTKSRKGERVARAKELQGCAGYCALRAKFS